MVVPDYTLVTSATNLVNIDPPPKKKTNLDTHIFAPVTVAIQSKAYICSHSPDETVGSNPTRDMDIC